MFNPVIRCVLCVVLLLSSQSLDAKATIDSLYHRLADVSSPKDSIAVLYNLIDYAPKEHQGKALELLYLTAERAKNEDTMLDALRMTSSLDPTNDSIQQLVLDRLSHIPESDAQRRAKLFITVRYMAKNVRRLPEEQRQRNLREYLSMHRDIQSLDTYQRIEYLFYLCAYLRVITDGDLLTKYFQELQELIDSLPGKDIFLRSLFYTQASLAYINNDMYDKAIEANKTMLSIINELTKYYELKGRTYRNADNLAYTCYRRLLLCHDSLSEGEVDIYYNRILSLVDRNPDIEQDFLSRRRPTIYFFMAKKRYDEAIPLIKDQLVSPDNAQEEYRYLIESLIEAADAVKDDDTLLYALKINNNLLKERIMVKAVESYKELQIIYEVNDLKQANDDLTMANRQITYNRHRELMTYSFVALAILLLLLIVVYIYFRQARNLSHRLAKSNELITNERDILKRAQKELIIARDKAKAADRVKTDFVNNMSHEIRTPLAAIAEYSTLISDCAEEDKREYIRRFADIVTLNTDLLLNLVNDVLELPAIENAKLSVHAEPTSVKDLCTLSIDSVRKRLQPGVDLIFENANDNDLIINTDPHRVEQVLLNMLSNAAKFTEKGNISLGYSLSDDGEMISFTVTDTGIGIPRGKEEIIFSRFEKLNSDSQGNGLGLYICRLLANLLKGTMNLDAEYRKGARFIFTIPVHWQETKTMQQTPPTCD